jgi:hypothetical protein
LKDLLLITPPFTQLNTPYPATAYLKGFLNKKEIESFQMDLGIEVILKIFSKSGLTQLFESAFLKQSIHSENANRIFALKEEYIKSIDDIITFLQGSQANFARQICSPNYLPRASRFEQIDDLEWAFGSMGFQDKAKHLATLYLEDLSDFIVECIDENFGFSRYAERLGRSANSFDELYDQLNSAPTYIDKITLEILKLKLEDLNPKLICFSIPFPGNLYSAFRCAQFIKKNYPNVKISMGGGFPNTELRSLRDKRVFEFFDFISLDDGELPLELIIKQLSNSSFKELKRTFICQDNEVSYINSSQQHDYKQTEIGVPDYSDLLLSKYISVIEIANPMHSLWSDGRWNKLTMAHGCYWSMCTFCDVSLDYIKLYEPIAAKELVDRVEQLIGQTGEKGFHFVDEAAPPALMRSFAIEIIKRKINITWWTNIRFEKSFTRDLCILLKASGCIAVSGGLEVASDRLLMLINKGVTVEQVARVTRNLNEAGIMVHSYLMYGYPSQTVQETIDSLEMVRQFFELNILQSAFWHQFALTAHSPIGLNPKEYGIIPDYKEISFADNDIEFKDRTGIDHSQFSEGLKKSLFNFLHGIGFELPLQEWFDIKIPKTTISENYILQALESETYLPIHPADKVIWLGGKAILGEESKSKHGIKTDLLVMKFHRNEGSFEIKVEKLKGEWLAESLERLSPSLENKLITFAKLKEDFEKHFDDFELFWYSKAINTLRKNALLIL